MCYTTSMDLYLTYDESRSGGEYESDEPYSSRAPTIINFSPRKLYLEESSVPGWLKETVTSEDDFQRGDTAYVVYVRYSDGDTFGYTSGYWEILGTFKDANKASALTKAINNNKYAGYKPWDGYFSSLEDVDYEVMVVQ